MSLREFYDTVVRMRAAHKLAATSLKMEDIHLAWEYEDKVDAEINRVEAILLSQSQAND